MRGDQAIASSMEIGVHNATLAIFVAVEILDSTEISVPAAVYSIFMFVFAALWGVALTPVAPNLRATSGASSLSALPRWLIASLSVDRELRGGRPGVVVGDEEHVVAEAARCRGSRG